MMPRMMVPMCVLLLTGLGASNGCISTPSIRSLSPEDRARVGQLPIYRSGSLPAETYEVVDSVEGLSCFRNVYSPEAPTEDEAIDSIKIKAVKLGADAVINLVCEEKGVVLMVGHSFRRDRNTLDLHSKEMFLI